MAATVPSFTVVGGCHLDRHLYLQGDPLLGRTNPASQRIETGGVAANIARHLAARGADVDFVGVQPPSELASMETRLRDSGIRPQLQPLAGEVPGYAAIMSPSGELVVGAAAMSLYDKVAAGLVIPRLDDAVTPIVMDANFPQAVLTAISARWSGTRPLFAAATSAAKVIRLSGCLFGLDALVLNRGEAAALGEAGSVAVMASALAARLRPGGCVLVSDGGDDAALASGGECVVARPPSIRLANANGAGDAMAAALFWGLVAQPENGLAARLDYALLSGAQSAAGASAENS